MPDAPSPNPTPVEKTEAERADEVVQTLESYRREAVEARKTGPNARDAVWEKNVDLYWNRYDHSQKADWQSREVMPEAPLFVDRWAAAMREALTNDAEWFVVEDPSDKGDDLKNTIRKFMEVLLSRVGRNQMGQPMDFAGVFEEQMKLGAMMACAGVVLWRKDVNGKGYVSVEPADPRTIWFDPTGRGLYRIRRTEVDLHKLKAMAASKDGNGKSVFNKEQIDMLTARVDEQMRTEAEAMKGHSQEVVSSRKPITLDEYLAIIIEDDGETSTVKMQLAVIANERFLIRGPEDNPFAHGRDWNVYCPLITVPLSVYGKSYMENWASLARTFTELTNLIIDGIQTTAMNAFSAVPELLEDPTQLAEGVSPNKVFLLKDGSLASEFIKSLELGNMPPEVFRVWQGIKAELQEGAQHSELALGQFPAKGDITAFEVNESQQGASALVRSIARTVESRFLQPMLDLIWKTGLQHLSKDDKEMATALGPDMLAALVSQKSEILSREVTFRVSGISGLVDRGQKLRAFMQFLGTLAQSPELLQLFFKKFPPDKVMMELMRLHGIDTNRLEMTEREQQVASVQQAAQTAGASAQEQLAGGQPPPTPGAPTNAEGT